MRNNQQTTSILSGGAISLALLGLVSTARLLTAADIPQFEATSQVEHQSTQADRDPAGRPLERGSQRTAGRKPGRRRPEPPRQSFSITAELQGSSAGRSAALPTRIWAASST